MFDRGRATCCCCLSTCTRSPRPRLVAMVELMNQYEQAGLHIDCRELPDHLPLYLEYLSSLPPDETPEKVCKTWPRFWRWLGGRASNSDSVNIISCLTSCWRWLAARSAVTVSPGRWRVKSAMIPARALDAVWEEEQVKFIEDNATARDSPRCNIINDVLAGDVAPQYVDDVGAGGLK